MARKMRVETGYGQRSIGAQNGYDDETGANLNDPDEILETMHELATKKRGDVPGHAEKAKYGSDRDVDNRRAHDRGDPEDFVSNHTMGSTPDDKKLMRQQQPNDRMYSYLQ